MYRAIHCQIQIFGCIEAEQISGMYDLAISNGEDSIGGAFTRLEGELPDDAALYGVLNQLYGLGICLQSVEVKRSQAFEVGARLADE